MVSSKRPHSLHLGPSSGFQRMLCWYQLARRLWSWAAMIKPSVSALRPAAFSHLMVLSWSTSACFTRCGYLPWRAFDSHSWPELLVTVVFGFGLCSSGIGGVRLILCRWYCGHSQFPTGLHWLSADGVQGFPVVMIFDKVGEGLVIFNGGLFKKILKIFCNAFKLESLFYSLEILRLFLRSRRWKKNVLIHMRFSVIRGTYIYGDFMNFPVKKLQLQTFKL